MRSVILASPEVYAEAYTEYPLPDTVYAKRAQLFKSFPERIMVVGCGFGHLVSELRKLGKDAWGVDASAWAALSRVDDHAWMSDILDGNNVRLLQGYIGPIATVITEDLLPWLTDEEAVTCANNCSTLGQIVIHLVTEQGEADYNYKPTYQWQLLTNQLTCSLEGF